MQHPKLKVSTLFIDIKHSFDHVLRNPLTPKLAAKAVPPYIVNWIFPFFSYRQIFLLFKGLPKIPTLVQVGVPQGSPILPLLFVIYVNFPHSLDHSSVLTISYLDDYAITVGSSSYKQNLTTLQTHYNMLVALARYQNITFSVTKTELMHLSTPKDKFPTCNTLITLASLGFQPGHQV